VFGRRVLSWTQEDGKARLKLLDAFTEQPLWSQDFAQDAKLWPTAADEVGVFSRSGKLAVVAVVDGTKRLEATVMPEPEMTDAFVLRTAEAYLLITSSPPKQRDGWNVTPVPGGFTNPLINGYVYGFDRTTKKQLYRTRVNGHGLALQQPSGPPVLVFASQIYEQPKRGQMRSPEAVLMCLDKRNGRAVFEQKLPAPLNMVDIVADPQKNAMTLRTLRNTLQLTFTSDPLPQEVNEPKGTVPEKAAEAKPRDAGLGGQVGAALIQGAAQIGRAARQVKEAAEDRKAVEKKKE
jgi:hypothetical protein